MHTELILTNWRFGQTQSERMCSDILITDGAKEVDPQTPLGGPDGGRDIHFTKFGERWAAACYFPTKQKTFSEIRDKFIADIERMVETYDPQGIQFFCNQKISPTERVILKDDAKPLRCDISHVERLRSFLDSPKGYGIRLEYLNIEMTLEEQKAFWASINDNVSDRLGKAEKALLQLIKKIDLIHVGTQRIEKTVKIQQTLDLQKLSERVGSSNPTFNLSLGVIQWLHHLMMSDSPKSYNLKGMLRNTQVWIGTAEGGIENATYVPPDAAEVKPLLLDLIYEWSTSVSSLQSETNNEKLTAIVLFFQKFLWIHPFLDGNGRVAREILRQQILDLMGKTLDSDFNQLREDYLKALIQADKGNHSKLKSLIEASIS